MITVALLLTALFLPGLLVLAACMLSSQKSAQERARRVPRPGQALPDEYRPVPEGNP